MAIICQDCGLVYANSTKVFTKGCRCGSRNLVDKSNPFAPTKPNQTIPVVGPVEKKIEEAPEQPPVKKPE